MQTITESNPTVAQGAGCLIRVSQDTAKAIFRILQIEQEVNGNSYSVDQLLSEVIEERQWETEDALQYHNEMGLTEAEIEAVLAVKANISSSELPLESVTSGLAVLKHLSAENLEVVIKERAEGIAVVTVRTLFNGQRSEIKQVYLTTKIEAVIAEFESIAAGKWDEISFNLETAVS